MNKSLSQCIQMVQNMIQCIGLLNIIIKDEVQAQVLFQFFFCISPFYRTLIMYILHILYSIFQILYIAKKYTSGVAVLKPI